MDSSDTISQNCKQKASSFLALFTSTGTLLCCTLPAAIAGIAGGSAVVSLISQIK